MTGRTTARWSGVWYVNIGEGLHRCWSDMRAFGFIAAGHGRVYSTQLDRLAEGDEIYAYQKARGYVGHGIVTAASAPVRDIVVGGGPLLDRPLTQPNLGHSRDDPEMAEYGCLVDWRDTVAIGDALTFGGIFTSRHVVYRLRHQPTLEYLRTTFA